MIRPGTPCWTRWLLAGALLLRVCAPLCAQTLDPPGTPGPAFTLEIEAPAEVQALLMRHLELQRYRELGDLLDGELDRLLPEAEQDAARARAKSDATPPLHAASRSAPPKPALRSAATARSGSCLRGASSLLNQGSPGGTG